MLFYLTILQALTTTTSSGGAEVVKASVCVRFGQATSTYPLH